MEENKMIINRLPMKTWNRLNVNHKNITLSDIVKEGPSDMTVSAGDAAAGIAVSAGGGEAAADPSLNPVSFCGSFISGFCKIMVAIFIAIFIHGFYKDGYDKNVIACVKNRW